MLGMGGEGLGTYQVGCTISNRNELLTNYTTRLYGNCAVLKIASRIAGSVITLPLRGTCNLRNNTMVLLDNPWCHL